MTKPNSQPSNLLIIQDTTNPATISQRLMAAGENTAIFTNGIYAAPQNLIVPTILSGFEFILDQAPNQNANLVIAINSNISFENIMDEKIEKNLAKPEEKASLEDQYVRAIKVCEPLALQNPNRLVAAIFYDEATPVNIYKGLHATPLTLSSLFKWGYGTNPDAPAIEGQEFFNTTYGFPLPNDMKPICHDITRREDQTGKIVVANLREPAGIKQVRYVTTDNKACFPMRNQSLARFFAPGF